MTESAGQHTQCLILGSGPAGMSAALYAARANLEPIILTGMELGGQVANTADVENYPGFPEGIQGPDLVERFQEQAERFGATFVFDVATDVDLSHRPFNITTFGDEFRAETLIIATGASVRHLGIPGEEEFIGRGVSYCATCDGHFFQDKNLIVVGGGDSALKEGIFLTRYANSVTIVHRRDELRGGIYLENKARENPKIDFMWDTIVTRINGNESVESVMLQNTKTGDSREHAIDGVFIFIGHIPNTDLFEGALEMDEQGYLVVDSAMHTNIPGVYAAGEVADPHFQQIVTSAGMGCAAAMEAVDFLEENT
jgi:thioredoxin reductase (NADPH)